MTEDKLIVDIINRVVLKDKTTDIKNLTGGHPIDWEKFKLLISYHELVPFVYLMLNEINSKIPSHYSDLFKNSYYYTLRSCMYFWKEFLRILEAFDRENILIVPIKGIAFLADLYNRNFIRPMVDIDLLIKEDDLQKGEQVFSNLGYRKDLSNLREDYWRNKQCHITFYKEGIKQLIDLHWSLDFKRGNCKVLPDLWRRIHEVEIEGRKIKLLSPEDTLFSLALHNRRFGKMLCLKNVCDAALLLQKYRGCFDWDYVLEQAKTGRMRAALFFVLSQVKILLKAEIPSYVENILKIPRWKKLLINRFIIKNTFLSSFEKVKKIYLKSHFLIYDSVWEPLNYILNIPQEQFAKFYSLKPYDKKTVIFYKIRLLYILFRVLFKPIQ